MQPIVTRKEAVARSLPRYFTGKPCKANHIAERTTKGTTCVECNRARGRVATPHDRLKKRERNLQQRYGMEIAEFVERVAAQANRCAICRNLSRQLVVDHCHTQKKVRELLCQRCNTLLGTVDDSIDVLQAAQDYLVKHS